ncbi:hypothetical protein H4R99_004462 [Coemansia sp. RSA 1722]|nr:hypothetical protein H4R99_004462 [Coemansia sp. RSA 1722]
MAHRAFVAAMGVVNPFALKSSLTFKSVIDSAYAVPVFFGPAKPVTTQFNSPAAESFTPRVERSTARPAVRSAVPDKGYLELHQGLDTLRTQIAALETTLLLARASVSVCASVPASVPAGEPSLTCAPVTASAPAPEPEPAHAPASDCTCEPATEIRKQVSEEFTLRQKCCCACMAKELERRARANPKPQKRPRIGRAWQKYLLTTTTPIPFNFHGSRVCLGRCEACRAKVEGKENQP